MSILVTIAAFLGIIVVLIFFHELGHFLTAKASGVRVYEFGLGFPPRVFAVKRGETEYSINAIPLGGFTKMEGEEDPAQPRGLASKSISTRLLVLSAGSLMNALLPILLFSVAFMVPHDIVLGEVLVADVAPHSPAALAGIRPGDTLLRVNNQSVHNIGDLRRYVRLNIGEETTILVKHQDSTVEEVELVPRWKPPRGEGTIGILMNTPQWVVVRHQEPFWRAIPHGATQCIETFILFKNEIIGLFMGTSAMQMTGPVGIAQISGEVAKAGISPLLEFAAFLSINLALVNILPLPALDGGRIAFVFLEVLRRGRRIAPMTERLVHLIGFLMLMGFTLMITFSDISRIISGGSLLP